MNQALRGRRHSAVIYRIQHLSLICGSSPRNVKFAWEAYRVKVQEVFSKLPENTGITGFHQNTGQFSQLSKYRRKLSFYRKYRNCRRACQACNCRDNNLEPQMSGLSSTSQRFQLMSRTGGQVDGQITHSSSTGRGTGCFWEDRRTGGRTGGWTGGRTGGWTGEWTGGRTGGRAVHLLLLHWGRDRLFLEGTIQIDGCRFPFCLREGALYNKNKLRY